MPASVSALSVAAELLALPTVPFAEALVSRYVTAFAEERGLESFRDPAGNVVVRYGSGRPLVLVAHMDHPGFLVSADGLEFKGRMAARHAVPGTALRFFRSDGAAPVGEGRVLRAYADGRGFLRAVDTDKVAGEFATWALPAPHIDTTDITAPACDDLLGCAAILAVFDELTHTRPEGVTVWGAFTRAEEPGFLGALEAVRLRTLPADADIVSVECSPSTPVACPGQGVVIRVGDQTRVFDSELTSALEAAASGVPGLVSQRRLMDGGTCEGTVFTNAGYRTAAIAMPICGYHNADEVEGRVVAESVRVTDYLGAVTLLSHLAYSPALRCQPHEPPWLDVCRTTARRELSGMTARR